MKPVAVALAVAVAVAAGGARGDETRWYDRVHVSGWVDTYFAFNTNEPASHDNFTPGTAPRPRSTTSSRSTWPRSTSA